MEFIDDPLWWEDLKHQWVKFNVFNTGVVTDEFDKYEMLAAFTSWMTMLGEQVPSGFITKTQAVEELTELLVDPKVGCLTWSPARQTFQHGKLV